MYGQAALAPQGEEGYNMSTFFHAVVNNLVLYFLNTLNFGLTLMAL